MAQHCGKLANVVNVTEISQSAACQVTFNFHVGDTGGTHVNRLFTSDHTWAAATLYGAHGAAGCWLPGAAGFTRGFQQPRQTRKLYAEVHCSLPMETVVHAVLPEVRTLFPSCSLEAFTVVRDPVDHLCSMCLRNHSDFRDLTSRARTVRQHHLEIFTHGIQACKRIPQLGAITERDVDKVFALLHSAKLTAVPLASLDGFLLDHFGFAPPVQDSTLSNKHTAPPGRAQTCRAALAGYDLNTTLHAELLLHGRLFPGQEVHKTC